METNFYKEYFLKILIFNFLKMSPILVGLTVTLLCEKNAYLHCKPITVMKTGFSLCSISNREKPVFITWEPCYESRFFPVWKYYTGKTLYWPCTGLQCSLHAQLKQIILDCMYLYIPSFSVVLIAPLLIWIKQVATANINADLIIECLTINWRYFFTFSRIYRISWPKAGGTFSNYLEKSVFLRWA
jgi:hypothetical protein